MLFREIAPHEFEVVYQMGFQEWSKGRTYQQYVKENQKEEDYGIRYVYADQENNNIIGSMIILSFNIKTGDDDISLHGLGSIVIDRDYRGMGYGQQMLKASLSLLEKQMQHPTVMLYSDIHPSFYHPFGFTVLPEPLQRSPKSICMVRSTPSMFQWISKLPVTKIPAYF